MNQFNCREGCYLRLTANRHALWIGFTTQKERPIIQKVKLDLIYLFYSYYANIH
jgi:hypothetical protein